jgi:hypothetical protein
MSNIEENSPIEENPVKEQKTTQGLAQERRNLRTRTNPVNYQLLDHGDSSHYSEDYFSEEYEEAPEEENKKHKPKSKKPKQSSERPAEEPEQGGESLLDDEEEDLNNIVNLSELKGTEVKNSKLLLALIEICINSKKYGINLANKSRIFWDEVYHIADFEEIFKSFKGETLRKYWRIISDIGKMSKVIKTIRKYEKLIDDPNAK